MIRQLDDLHGGLRDLSLFNPCRRSDAVGLPETINFDEKRDELVEIAEFIEWQLSSAEGKS